MGNTVPAEEEIRALLQEKEAMRGINKQQLEEMIRAAEARGVKVEFLPSTLVFTKKPRKSGGKRKMGWVICGNCESRSDQESNFSSDADSTAFRIMLVVCAKQQWQAGTLDVKTFKKLRS